MLSDGIYPAAVTPFDEKGGIDYLSVARLLAWFEAGGCKGAVLAGTNGEGPSLSAVEKRDLLKAAIPLKGKLDLILGIATSSTDEAIWLCKQARNEGAVAALLMAPYYFKEATEEGVAAWFELVMSQSPVPVLIYNFPQRTGFTISPELLHRLSMHENYAGGKDSSGLESNIPEYRAATDDKPLFVGNETLLFSALMTGWNGSISGAANVVPMWLSQIAGEEFFGDTESAETKFKLLLPVLLKLRSCPQPAMNKAILHAHGVLEGADLRLPLFGVHDSTVDEVFGLIEKQLGPIIHRK